MSRSSSFSSTALVMALTGLALTAAQNANAFSVTDGLFRAEAARVASGNSFAGSPIPPAVSQVLSTARASGAIAYDITEIERDRNGNVVLDPSEGNSPKGLWNPYPNPGLVFAAVDNMAFPYTMITPQVLAADLADHTTIANWWNGVDSATNTVQYVKKAGGTGNIIEPYDEAFHPDIFERGPQGQKWSENCAIMSDGSLHCVPAARHASTPANARNIILTNASLARGLHLLWHGHIRAQAGVIFRVELSGRISKRVARGQAVLIDPLPLLRAWGFQIAPGVQLTYANTDEGLPVTDPNQFIVRKR